jgi:hypothetical protein
MASLQVINGATLRCIFGQKNSDFVVLPRTVYSNNDYAANIMDHKPMVNIFPFEKCMSPFNPAVWVSGGQVPCTPATVTPWVPGATNVLLDQYPALNNTSVCVCALGGVVFVVKPNQYTEVLP